MKSLLSGIFIVMFVVGCGNEPKSLASGESLRNLTLKDDTLTPLSVTALKFEGRTSSFPVSQCDVWLTLKRPDDQFLAKLGLSIHGVEVDALDLNVYRLKDGVFYLPEDTAGENGEWTLAGLSSDSSQNPNDLSALKTSGELEAFFLLRLVAGFDINVFILNLEHSLHSEQLVNSASLDMLSSSFYESLHFNHYDNSTCEGFRLTGVEKIDFKPAKHDHHDHDHDHDHQH